MSPEAATNKAGTQRTTDEMRRMLRFSLEANLLIGGNQNLETGGLGVG